MADKTINELPKATDIFDTDSFLLEQSGTAKKLEGYILRGYAERAAGHVHQGEKGDKGDRGISITRVALDSGTHEAGTVDTYRIYYSDNTSSTFQVTNGADGAAAIFDTTATIPASGWSGTSAPFTNNVTVTGITATDTPLVDLVASSTFATAEDQIEAWGYVYRIVTAANKITVYATEKPAVNLPIQIRVIRK